MRDAHLELSGSRVTLALEPDHARSLSELFAEVAAETVGVLPTGPAHAARVRASRVIIGDFASTPPASELLVGSSRGAITAESLGAAHLVCGFPVTDRYGASRELTIGYAGATRIVDQAATLLANRDRARHYTNTMEGVRP
jgi:nitrogenase molybdenum-iron protein NifN